jgi:hypothetical protein
MLEISVYTQNCILIDKHNRPVSARVWARDIQVLDTYQLTAAKASFTAPKKSNDMKIHDQTQPPNRRSTMSKEPLFAAGMPPVPTHKEHPCTPQSTDVTVGSAILEL